MKKEPDIYKCIKLSLNQVAKSKTTIDIIQKSVFRANQIWRRAIHLLKIYLLEDLGRCRHLSTDFLDLFLQSVCKQSKRGRKATTNAQQKSELMTFYECFTQKFDYQLPDLSYEHLNTVLDYISVSWMTAIENNIKSNYVSYVESYVNFCYNARSHLRTLKEDTSIDRKQKVEKKREFLRRLRSVKNDILNLDEDSTCLSEDIEFVQRSRSICLPNKLTYEKDLIYYDVHVNPIDYLHPMIRMMKYIEDAETDFDKPRLKNVLPSRNSMTSKHIRFDTKTLMNLFKYGEHKVKECQELVWNDQFRMERKCFKMKGYVFNNSIVTDGVSCTLLFIREDKYGKRFKMKKLLIQREPYLEDIFGISDDSDGKDNVVTKIDADEQQLISVQNLKSRNIVGIDPNMGNLIYCSDEKNNKFRYTQGQRKVEIKMQKYIDYHEDLMTQNIEGRAAKDWETDLSKHDSKTLITEKYVMYLKDRYIVDAKLWEIYEDKQLKKNNLHRYRNSKNSEDKMIKQFQQTFGKPENVLVCFGDWEQKQHRKYKEPTKGKGMRKLLRSFGYLIYLIWEHRTSLQCSGCKTDDAQTEKFYSIKFHDKTGVSRTKKLHGLLKCKTCKRLWNRDANSSNNIRNTGRSIVEEKGRPVYLCRRTKASEVKEIKDHENHAISLSQP